MTVELIRVDYPAPGLYKRLNVDIQSNMQPNTKLTPPLHVLLFE